MEIFLNALGLLILQSVCESGRNWNSHEILSLSSLPIRNEEGAKEPTNLTIVFLDAERQLISLCFC